MKIIKMLLCFLAVSTGPFLQAADDANAIATTLADQVTKKDGRNWKLAYQAKNDNMEVKQYTLENETPDNWTELFNVHAFSGITLELDKYEEAFVTQLQKVLPDNKIQHKVIKSEPNSVLGEWWIDDKTPNDQHEIFRVMSNGQDIVVLRYTTRKAGDLATKDIDKWQNILMSVELPKSTAPATTTTPTATPTTTPATQENAEPAISK